MILRSQTLAKRSRPGSSPGEEGLLQRGWPIIAIAFVLVGIRWGTFVAPPTWDSAMSVWPAAIEISERNSISEVLALPTYGDSGPNTHTLSLVTLLTAGLLEVWGPEATRVVLHVVNCALLLGIGLMVAKLVRDFARAEVAWLAAGIAVLSPMMVGQSAYLYTDLPSAFFVMLSLVAATRGKEVAATIGLAAAIWIKALALVAVPAVVVLLLLRKKGGLSPFLPLVALVALIPALVVPQPGTMDPALDRLATAQYFSWSWLMRAPELLLLPGVLILRRIVKGEALESPNRDWFLGTAVLVASMALFFTFNGAVTAGHIFIPRYGVMLIGPVAVVLADAFTRYRFSLQIAALTAVLTLSLVATRGPLALGAGSPLPPEAERSLAFLDLFDDHRRGLQILGETSLSGVPGFHDHYASYGLRYPDLGHFVGEFGDLRVVRSREWQKYVSDLPDDFAMFLSVPILGGDGLILMYREVSDDPEYEVTRQLVGTARVLPAQIVRVTRQAE